MAIGTITRSIMPVGTTTPATQENLSTSYKDVQNILGAPVTIGEIEKPNYEGISKQTQSMIDILSRAAESKARASVIRRGMEGSSTEALNIGRSVTEASVPLVQQELDRQQAQEMQYLQQQAERGNKEAELELTRRTAYAGLTSDEVASLRAIADKTKDRELQKYLGEIGVNASMSAADKAEHAASVQAKSGIWSGLISGVAQGGTAAAIMPF